MKYISNEMTYMLSYSDLKEKYIMFCEMDNVSFMNNLHDALHLACIICFLKEIPTNVCLTDTGIIHELVHLTIKGGTTTPLGEIREQFKNILMLA